MNHSAKADAADRERHLWRRMNEQRDQAAREELVGLYLPMARRMARRYSGVVEPYDDLLQVASLGLLNAVDRYDPGRGTPFGAFAKPTILGELKRYFRDKVWSIRVPRVLHDRMAAIDTATEELTEELSRPPLAGEIATRLQMDLDAVLETLAAQQNRRPLGLDAPVHEDAEGGSGTAEWLGDLDRGYEVVEDRLVIERVLPSLDERARQVLRLRFVDDLPQSKIAARIGCSQMHVSRLLRSTLARLREEAEAGEVAEAR